MAIIKDHYTCSLNLTFDLLGGKWKLRILWHVLYGDNRFSLLMKNIEGITEKVLTTQLRELEESGLITREVVTKKPLNVVYSISDEHQNIKPIIDSLCDFSTTYAEQNSIQIQSS